MFYMKKAMTCSTPPTPKKALSAIHKEPTGEDILNPRQIDLSLEVDDWLSAVVKLSQRLWREKRLRSLDEFVQGVIDRENIISTYCGRMIAIPHAVSPVVTTPSLCVGRSAGFIWRAHDEWVRLVFLLAIPQCASDKAYLSRQVDILSVIAGLALNDDHLRRWLNAATPEEMSNSILGALPPINP